MAIELHHLHPSHDDEVARLKSRIAELEDELRWRNVDDKFPTADEGYILVLWEDGLPDIGYIGAEDDVIETVRDRGEGHSVKWWMPLPLSHPMCGRPLNKTFPNELKANEKLCIKYEKEWMDECRKNENKIVPYTAIPSEKVEELESLIRSAESIFEALVNVGILSFFLKLKDRYEVSYRAF